MARGKKYGKRKHYKKKSYKRKTALVNNALNPIAQRYICKMKYCDTFLLSSVVSGYRFNLNSIFDPNRTGIGTQPYGHDTMQNMYNRYRVIACSYVITAYNAGSAIRVAAIPANDEVIVSSVSDAIEKPRTRFITQFPGGNTNKLTGRVYMPSLVGRTKAQYMADDRYQSQFGSNPVELAVLNIVHGDLLDNFPASTNVSIELTYTVECFDVNTLPRS